MFPLGSKGSYATITRKRPRNQLNTNMKTKRQKEFEVKDKQHQQRV